MGERGGGGQNKISRVIHILSRSYADRDVIFLQVYKCIVCVCVCVRACVRACVAATLSSLSLYPAVSTRASRSARLAPQQRLTLLAFPRLLLSISYSPRPALGPARPRLAARCLLRSRAPSSLPASLAACVARCLLRLLLCLLAACIACCLLRSLLSSRAGCFACMHRAPRLDGAPDIDDHFYSFSSPVSPTRHRAPRFDAACRGQRWVVFGGVLEPRNRKLVKSKCTNRHLAGQEAAASFDDTARAELLDYIILKPYVLDAFKVCV